MKIQVCMKLDLLPIYFTYIHFILCTHLKYLFMEGSLIKEPALFRVALPYGSHESGDKEKIEYNEYNKYHEMNVGADIPPVGARLTEQLLLTIAWYLI